MDECLEVGPVAGEGGWKNTPCRLLDLHHPPLPPPHDRVDWERFFWITLRGEFSDSAVAELRSAFYEARWLREADWRSDAARQIMISVAGPFAGDMAVRNAQNARDNAAAWRAWGEEHAK